MMRIERNMYIGKIKEELQVYNSIEDKEKKNKILEINYEEIYKGIYKIIVTLVVFLTTNF